MDLYYGRISGNSSRVVFALHEAGVAFTPHLLDTRAGENRAAGYLAVNPLGKIPALVDGDFRLWESNAINWYLAEKHPEARLLPGSVEGRAAVQRWLFFQAGHVTPSCMPFLRNSPRAQAFWRIPSTPQERDVAGKELARWLPVLERALQGRAWLEGEFSLADIAYVPHLWLATEGGLDLAPYPCVRGWLDRLLSRPAWRRTAELVFGG